MLNFCFAIFVTGLFGVYLSRGNLVKTLMSIELMIIAGVLNFCFANISQHIIIFIATTMIINFAVICLIFAVYTHLNNDNSVINN